MGGVANSRRRTRDDHGPRRDGRPPQLQQAAVQPDGPDRDDDARDDELHAVDADQDLSELSGQQAEILGQKVPIESLMLSATADADFEFESQGTETTFHRQIQRQIHQFQRELDDISHKCTRTRMTLPKLDLLEVMCSDQSELVTQMISAGGRAKRWFV